jgi:hypothetical protein
MWAGSCLFLSCIDMFVDEVKSQGEIRMDNLHYFQKTYSPAAVRTPLYQ